MAKGDERVGRLVKCSFCGKPQDQVRRIVAGPGVYICDECVSLCQEIVAEDTGSHNHMESTALPKPAELKAVLDQYVVGQEAAKKALDTIAELGGVLGLFAKTEEKPLDEEIEAMIEERNKARAEKNWAKADEIRDKLKEMHIVLKDTPMGVKWSYEE